MEYMAAQMDRQIEGAIFNREQLEADAARYRWLRDTTNWASNSSGERIDVRNSPELWDSAIDEAIARAALLPDNAAAVPTKVGHEQPVLPNTTNLE